MKILIACEYIGKLRDRFIDQGHEVWSCDLLEGEGKHIDRHIVDDYRSILKWFKPDMLCGIPPCTFICVSGNSHYANTQKRLDGIAFFKEMWEQDIPKICLENPVSVVSTKVAKATQWVQPWQYGHGETKKTGLWLKGLPKLKPTNIVEGRSNRIHFMSPSPLRSKKRSETYDGIADAMVNQWTNL